MRVLELVRFVLESITWPIASIILTLILWPLLRDFLRAIGQIRWGGLEIEVREYGKSAADPKRTAVRPPSSVRNSPDWKRVDDLFWLGHDLMLTIDAVLRGGRRADIVFGCNHALLHLRELGLVNGFDQRLAGLNKWAEDSSEADWTRAQREDFAKQLRQLIGDMGHFLAGAKRE